MQTVAALAICIVQYPTPIRFDDSAILAPAAVAHRRRQPLRVCLFEFPDQESLGRDRAHDLRRALNVPVNQKGQGLPDMVFAEVVNALRGLICHNDFQTPLTRIRSCTDAGDIGAGHERSPRQRNVRTAVPRG